MEVETPNIQPAPWSSGGLLYFRCTTLTTICSYVGRGFGIILPSTPRCWYRLSLQTLYSTLRPIMGKLTISALLTSPILLITIVEPVPLQIISKCSAMKQRYKAETIIAGYWSTVQKKGTTKNPLLPNSLPI